MRNLINILFLIYSVLFFGQSNDFTAEKIKIENYVKLIDSTQNNYREILAEGPIIYKSLFKKNGGWGAYNLNKKNEPDIPLRIKYNASKDKMHEDLKIYYKNGKIIFASLIITNYKRKWKVYKKIEKKFYFFDNQMILQQNKLK